MKLFFSCCLSLLCLGLGAEPYRGRILKVYEAIVHQDMVRAERLLSAIADGDTQPLYPVFELASCYLAIDTASAGYAPLMAYRTLRKVESLGKSLDEAESFLAGYGLSMPGLRRSIEERLVTNAFREQSIAGWDRFLLNIDNDSLKRVAEDQRMELAYQAIVREPYADRCEAFIDRYPTGRYTEEIIWLRDKLVYESIGDNLHLLEAFVREHPSSAFVGEARARLDQIYAPELTSGQALSLASTLLAPAEVVEAFPYANSAHGTEQLIAVTRGDGLSVSQCTASSVLYSVKLPGAQNGALDRLQVDKVEKVVVNKRLMFLIVYRYYTYSRECPDCVERGYTLYEPVDRRLETVVLSGVDRYGKEGALERIEGAWLPCAENEQTAWLKRYAHQELGEVFSE